MPLLLTLRINSYLQFSCLFKFQPTHIRHLMTASTLALAVPDLQCAVNNNNDDDDDN